METISVILLTVVLLAQIVLFVLYFREKHHSNRRHNAMLTYIDRVVEDGVSDCKNEVNDLLVAFGEKTDERFKSRDVKAEQQRTELLKAVHNALSEQDKKVSEELSGMLLDYTQAQEAANKINDFGASLANIFDYDPIRAIQRGRKKEAN